MFCRLCQFQCIEGHDKNKRRLDTIVLMASLQVQYIQFVYKKNTHVHV